MSEEDKKELIDKLGYTLTSPDYDWLESFIDSLLEKERGRIITNLAFDVHNAAYHHVNAEDDYYITMTEFDEIAMEHKQGKYSHNPSKP